MDAPAFEAEESGGNPYRSEVLSQLGLAHWPDIMRQAITDPDGSEVTLGGRLESPGFLAGHRNVCS